ncbi:MAG TPA: TolC family protein [Acetobacteraceae bacterium]|nr:TolC family protein [Acetobacteraceae bacterium]
MLAPGTPDRPWVVPQSFDDLPLPGTIPTNRAPAGTTATPGGATPARSTGAAMANPPRPSRYASDFTRANAVPIDPARRYDLAGLIDLAQRNNPETREAWERARQAALAVGLVETTYVPQISAEAIGGFQHTPLPIPTNLIPKGYFTANTREVLPTLTAKWLLFDFGQRAGTEQAARANSFVANVAFTGAHQKLIYAVSRDYFALGAARGRLHVAQQALKTALVVQDASEMRQVHGLGTITELAQARRQTAQERFNLARATGDEHAAYAALVASMGVAPSTRIETADSTELALPAAPSEDVDQFIQDALANRPDIIASLGKIRAAEATLSSARATYYPTIGLEAQAYQNVGGLSTNGSSYYSVNEPGANILLKLSLPLFDGGARDARVETARAEVEAAHASLDQARDTAVKQVTNAYDALRTSFAEYAAALTLNEAAQTAYDAALDAYRHGVGTYTDLVNNETALSQAQSEKEDAHANVFTAAAALAFATGSILSQP